MTASGSTSQDDDQNTSKLVALLLNVAPSFAETARDLLRQSLQEQYPLLHLDPDTTLLGTPTWELIDEKIVPGPTHYQSLSTLLARQAITWVATLCIEGEHFLTQEPVLEPAVHLPVRIVEIANTINILARVMSTAYEEQLVNFWSESVGNGPRWQAASSTLRNVWNVQHVDGWTEEDCAMARGLFHTPDRATRHAKDPFQSRAYLLDVDVVRGTKTEHTDLVFNAVLVGKSQGQTLILSYSLDSGYEKFESLEKLGASLSAQLEGAEAYDRLEWRLYEPDDNYFDHLAFKLIALQLQSTREVTATHGTPAAVVSVPPKNIEHVTTRGPDLDWYQSTLPNWLAGASNMDRTSYSRHLKDLAALHRRNAGQTYQDDIPAIEQYALDRLKIEIEKEHPKEKHLALDKFSVEIRTQVVWGLFPVPGQIEVTTLRLGELALQNLIALPFFSDITLRMDSHNSIPSWMTIDYIKTLITRIDVGTAYPTLIRSKLMDDAAESARRKNLYTQHLRIQLPMLALQYKIRKESGIDERGYHYVLAVLQSESSDRTFGGQAIVMRRLSFTTTRRLTNSHDVVENMYVIGPQRIEAGPCLLYRPLFEPVLMQFPSPANLIYTINHSHTLRDSIVAWLPDSVRDDYTNYVFPGSLPSPWMVGDLLTNPSKIWTYSDRVILGEDILKGDLFTTLFNSNANALIELADRESVSNVESRWATFKKAGWLLFNASMPFLGRFASTGAWIWQIVDQLQAFVEAHEHDDQQAQWSALTDVLLNLGMALALHAAQRNRPTAAPVRVETKTPGAPAIVKQLPMPDAHDSPPGHSGSLYTLGAVKKTSKSLGAALDTFKIDKPANLEGPITEEGADQYLYRDGQHYYAPAGERWFRVELEGERTVVIIDPNQPNRTGLPLLHNAKGEWFVDTRLRLSGGGLESRTAKSKEHAQEQSNKLREKLTAFEQTKKDSQRELQKAHTEMSQAPSTSAQAKRQAYLEKLSGLSASYEDARQQLVVLNAFSPVMDYQSRALGYLKAQLELNEANIREQLTSFSPQLEKVLNHLETHASSPQASHIEDFKQLSEMNRHMIERLDYAQSRFAQARGLGEAGMELILNCKMPYGSDNLKALQVTMARALCLRPQSLGTEADAWQMLVKTTDAADIAVQTLHNTLKQTSESRLDERVQTLGSLVEQFKFVDERLQDIALEFPEQILAEPLAKLRESLRGFASRASAQLAPLHSELEQLRSKPKAPLWQPRSEKKFIHTRYNGTLIGEPRVNKVGLETGLVDILSPLTGKIIATFHEKTPGVWAQRVDPSASQPPRPVFTLETSLSRGQKLLDELPAFQTRVTTRSNDTSRTPLGVEYMLGQHAELLAQAAEDIDESLTKLNATEVTQHPAVAERKKIEDAARALYKQADVHVAKMIKQQPPTLTGLEWLKNHDLIKIKKAGKRRRLKSITKDYLDEYTVTDKSSKAVLWYAQFHYRSAQASLDRFISARLKTPAERELGSATDDVNGLNAEQQTAFYRSTIGLAQARALFFPNGTD
ncbi:hypothetical protein [Pseudomonas orientalis]|uniref:Uncharacterized protein n=1 Tax=Pseudomonas orientalis TaxID=76758 RepID=A0A2L0S3W0_9PSED|nr:hypothetical protein [Pseudomonas orientalis]AUZ48901.1 hypothetical protein BOP93_25965 [Pseudomonas orientalis]